MTYAGGFHRDKNGFWIDAAGKWPDNHTVTLLQAVEKAVKEEEAFREKNDRYVSDILTESPKQWPSLDHDCPGNYADMDTGQPYPCPHAAPPEQAEQIVYAVEAGNYDDHMVVSVSLIKEDAEECLRIWNKSEHGRSLGSGGIVEYEVNKVEDF